MNNLIVCSIEDCQKDHSLIRGMCYAHYRQSRRRGDFGKCSHSGCEWGQERAGYCVVHYTRMSRNQDMDAPIKRQHKDQLTLSVRANNAQAVIRKMKNRSSTDENGCWIYMRANGRGYGELYADGRTWLAHRLVAKFSIPEFSPECQVHHKCAVALCCNPAHLQAVTPQENTAEMNERQFYIRRIEQLEDALRNVDPENHLLSGA